MTEQQIQLMRRNLLAQVKAATDLIHRSVGTVEMVQGFIVRERIYDALDRFYDRSDVRAAVADGLMADIEGGA